MDCDLTDSNEVVQLQRRAVRGTVMSLVSQAIRLLANLVTPLVLGIYLGPEEFGLIGIAFSIQALLLIVRDAGLGNALIQRKDVTEVHVNTVLWVNVTVSAVLVVALVLLAGPIAHLYERPRLVPILWLLSLPILAQGFSSIQEVQLRKGLQFGRLLVADGGSVLLASIAAIVAVLLGAGVWSLVVRLVAAPLLMASACWVLSSWRPKRVFSWPALGELWAFGSFMFLSMLFGYGLVRLDNAIIGWRIEVAAAGTFFLARNLALTPLQETANAVSRVLFPVFSSIQHDLSTIRSGYLNGTRCLATLVFPMMAALIAVSPEMIELLLPPKWLPMVPVIQVLSLQGVMICTNTPASQMLLARGRSRLQFGLAVLSGTAAITALVAGCQWGVTGAAVCWTLVRFCVAPVVLWFACREVEMTFAAAVVNVLRPACAAAGAAITARGLCWVWSASGGSTSYALLGSEIVVGIGVYIGLCAILLPQTLRKINHDLRASFLRSGAPVQAAPPPERSQT